MLLQATEHAADLPGGYGLALLQTLLALAAVCILAWVVLRWAAQKGLGVGARGQRIQVLERVALDARRTLWLVQVDGRVLLIGAGEAASPALLADLSERAARTGRGRTFVEILHGPEPGPENAERPGDDPDGHRAERTGPRA